MQYTAITKLGEGRFMVEGDGAWCEVAIEGAGAARAINARCGTAWPTAWPELFERGADGRVQLTPRGLELLDEADRASADEAATPTEAVCA